MDDSELGPMAEAMRVHVQSGDVQSLLSLLLSFPRLINFEAQNGETPLYTASRFGRSVIVGSLISFGADVNHLLSNGDHNLMASAKMGHAEVTELLLEHGANPDFQRPNGSSPLFISSQNGHVSVVETLLRNSATVDLRRCTGTPSLYMACQRGHKDVVSTLIQYGANPRLVNNKGRSALHAAAYNGHYEIVKILMETGVDPHLKDQDDDTPFSDAAMHGHYEILELFKVHESFTPNEVAHAEILSSSFKGDMTKLNKILRDNPDVLNEPVGTPALYFAAERGFSQVVDFLIMNGASVNLLNKAGKTALHAAAVHGHTEIVQLLLVAGADVTLVDANLQRPEDVASTSHHDNIASLLKANTTTTWDLWSGEKKKEERQSYLQWLPHEMTSLAVDMLLQPPAGDHIKNAFMKALQIGNVEPVSHLLQSYPSMASLQCPGKSQTALSIAASSGSSNIVQMLLQTGASVHSTHENGRTALHEAASVGSSVVAQTLLLAGADVSTRDSDGLLAYDIAKRRHCKETSSLLKKWQKNVQKIEHRNKKREESLEKIERKMSRSRLELKASPSKDKKNDS